MGRLWRVLLGYAAHALEGVGGVYVLLIYFPAALITSCTRELIFPAHARRSFRMDEDSVSRYCCGCCGNQRPCFGRTELLPIPGGGAVITCRHHTRFCAFLFRLCGQSQAIFPLIELLLVVIISFLLPFMLFCYISPWQPSLIELLCTLSFISIFILPFPLSILFHPRLHNPSSSWMVMCLFLLSSQCLCVII